MFNQRSETRYSEKAKPMHMPCEFNSSFKSGLRPTVHSGNHATQRAPWSSLPIQWQSLTFWQSDRSSDDASRDQRTYEELWRNLLGWRIGLSERKATIYDVRRQEIGFIVQDATVSQFNRFQQKTPVLISTIKIFLRLARIGARCLFFSLCWACDRADYSGGSVSK